MTKFSEETIENFIANTEGSWRMEGLIICEETKKDMRRILRDEITGDEAVENARQRILAKHK